MRKKITLNKTTKKATAKITATVLTATLAIGMLAGCGNSDDEKETTKKKTNNVAKTEETETATEEETTTYSMEIETDKDGNLTVIVTDEGATIDLTDAETETDKEKTVYTTADGSKITVNKTGRIEVETTTEEPMSEQTTEAPTTTTQPVTEAPTPAPTTTQAPTQAPTTTQKIVETQPATEAQTTGRVYEGETKKFSWNDPIVGYYEGTYDMTKPEDVEAYLNAILYNGTEADWKPDCTLINDDYWDYNENEGLRYYIWECAGHYYMIQEYVMFDYKEVSGVKANLQYYYNDPYGTEAKEFAKMSADSVASQYGVTYIKEQKN